MKIIQVITQQEAGGAQTRAVKMMDELNRRGHDVRTVFFYLKRKVYEDSPQIVNLWSKKPRPWHIPVILFRLYKYLREQKADIVMPYTHWGNTVTAPVARLAGAKIVLANQTQDPAFEPKLARILDTLWGTSGVYSYAVCNSATTLEKLAKIIPANYANKLRKVTLGVMVEDIPGSKEEIRKCFGLPSGNLIIHVGRLSYQKNHDGILNAIAKVPNAAIAFVGDGERMEEMKQLAKTLGIADRVFFMGERRAGELAAILRSGDLFLFPSRFEGFGLAPVEACAAGLPVIVSDIPVFHEVMQMNDGPRKGKIAALMVPFDDPGAIAKGVKKVLTDDVLRTLLAENSAMITAQYGLGTMTDDYEEIFKEAVSACAGFPVARP